MFEKIISKNVVNTGRQPEADIMKAFVLLNLAIIHVYVECSTAEELFYGLRYFFDSIIGGPFAAPFFMFSMGLGLAYTKKDSAEDLFRRGRDMLFIGIAHNVCRYLIPSLIGYVITKDADFYLARLPYRFFSNDILQFATLAFFTMGLLKKFKLSIKWIWVISVIMMFIALPFNGLYFDNHAINIILGFFIGTENPPGEPVIYTDFPLFIWFFIYASGSLFGELLKRVKDKKKFYAIVTPPCLIIFWATIIHQFVYEYGMMMGPGDNVFYHMNPYEALVCNLNSIACLGLCFFLSRILPGKIQDIANHISRNINVIYFIQWVLVFWTVDLIIYVITGSTHLDQIPALIVGIILSILTVILSDVWVNLRRRISNEKKI
ncbi:MAG: heparan-alpha-glucosaminide N-acetyltransferase domain-containing protein [Lachnospiraceae bacterium]|nr:heparan-alpha-glucosaminide N-acetyltransferase domain-containing protein [Lachnospiraceae bacterium]